MVTALLSKSRRKGRKARILTIALASASPPHLACFVVLSISLMLRYRSIDFRRDSRDDPLIRADETQSQLQSQAQ
jgi:hypothetical protein